MSPRFTADPFTLHLRLLSTIEHGCWPIVRAVSLREGWLMERFPAFAARHHVAHSILAAFEQSQEPSAMPDAVVAAMRDEVARRAGRAARLAALLPELNAGVDRASVPHLVLKGIPFATRYYGDAAHRRQGDIDLLVGGDALPDAISLLHDMGFRSKARRLEWVDGRSTVRPEIVRTMHALLLRRGDTAIDLHWSLRTAPAYRIDEGALWSGAQRVRVGDVAYPVPSDEHALLLALLSLAHDIGRGGCTLKGGVDIRRILRTAHDTIDWPEFFRRRRDDGTLSVVVNTLDLVLEAFAERLQVAALADALNAYASLLALDDPDRKLALLGRRRGSAANQCWMLAIYPVRWSRDIPWWLKRSVPHAGRIFGASGRALRFVVRATPYLLGSALRRRRGEAMDRGRRHIARVR